MRIIIILLAVLLIFPFLVSGTISDQRGIESCNLVYSNSGRSYGYNSYNERVRCIDYEQVSDSVAVLVKNYHKQDIIIQSIFENYEFVQNKALDTAYSQRNSRYDYGDYANVWVPYGESCTYGLDLNSDGILEPIDDQIIKNGESFVILIQNCNFKSTIERDVEPTGEPATQEYYDNGEPVPIPIVEKNDYRYTSYERAEKLTILEAKRNLFSMQILTTDQPNIPYRLDFQVITETKTQNNAQINTTRTVMYLFILITLILIILTFLSAERFKEKKIILNNDN